MNGEDRLIAGEGAINHFWMVCFSNDLVREKLGLKYISQMRDKDPYWYLWFHDFPGVFKFSLLECVADSRWDWRALLRIKYYPHPDESIFHGLSVLEQICRLSEIFQTKPAQWQGGETSCACCGGVHHHEGERFADLREGTGAPLAGLADGIPEDFFLAGQMEIKFLRDKVSEVSWESQDYWRVTMTENYYMGDQDGATMKVLRKGDIDRDFPGWMLTDFVARRFAMGWQEHHGFSRASELLSNEEGLEFSSDGRNLRANPSATIRCHQVCRRMEI